MKLSLQTKVGNSSWVYKPEMSSGPGMTGCIASSVSEKTEVNGELSDADIGGDTEKSKS